MDMTGLIIREAHDVERARRFVRAFVSHSGILAIRREELVLAVSEIVTNVIKHSTSGGVLNCSLKELPDYSLAVVEIRDSGPGIADLAQAMQDGFSTTGSMGSGLPGARRLVDHFEIESNASGTVITLGKRIPRS